MNAYGLYQRTRDASWQCLLDCGVNALPVSASSIAARFGIGLYQYGPNAQMLCSKGLGRLLSADGFAFAEPDGQLLIFFDEQKPLQQIRFTLAHELGHILLGHVSHSVPCGRFINPSDPKLERQADQFAARLLAPAFVLWHLNISTADEIAQICNIPEDIAIARARRMKTLMQRNRWLTSPLEQRLFEQFHFSSKTQEICFDTSVFTRNL